MSVLETNNESKERKIVIRLLLVNPRANSPNQYHENYIADNY